MNDDLSKYYNSDFYKASEYVIGKITEKFNEYGFIEKYNEENKSVIGNWWQYAVDKIRELNELQKLELNEMTKMLSRNNCSYKLYQIAEALHMIILESYWEKNDKK